MSQRLSHRVRLVAVDGIPPGELRGVATLEGVGGVVGLGELAGQVSDVVFNSLQRAIEHWQVRQGKPWVKFLYHGWTRRQYRGKYVDIFVFKAKHRGVNYRLYGFICHPPKMDLRFQLFVGTTLQTKDKNQTEEKYLAQALAILESEEVARAIDEFEY